MRSPVSYEAEAVYLPLDAIRLTSVGLDSARRYLRSRSQWRMECITVYLTGWYAVSGLLSRLHHLRLAFLVLLLHLSYSSRAIRGLGM